MTRTSALRFVPAVLLLLAVSPSAAQEHRTGSIPALLARYEREMATPPLYQSEAGGLVLVMITGRQGRGPAARLDSLLTGLEALARNPRTLEDTRADAAGLLALAGEQSVQRPRPGTVPRLQRLYRETESELVRRTVMMTLPRQAEQTQALAFLRAVAEKEAESFPEEGWEAVRNLISSGTQGREVVARMHRSASPRNPVVRSLVALYVRNGFRLPTR